MERTRRARLSLAVACAVILWVGRSVEGRSGQGEMPGASSADLERGEQLYVSACAGCHGMEGDEIPDINLTRGTFRRPYADRELVNIIRNGIPGTPMAPSGLPQDQPALVVKYLRWASGALTSPAATAAPSPAASLVGRAANGKALRSWSAEGAVTSGSVR